MKNQVRRPPRLIMSPNRQYICLLWPSESRYEILHVPSLLMGSSSGFPAPVDFGSGVMGFAWIQNESFAILHSGDAIKETRSKSGRFDFRSSMSKNMKSMKSKVSNLNPKSDAMNTNTHDTNVKVGSNGHVHLKHLIESKENSSYKRNSSQAAATPKILGELKVRGGNPTKVFGGPLLCVACTPKHTDDREEGSAFFYSKRTSGAVDGAEAYTTVGPSFPHPDLVEWNVNGDLCCICVGTRIGVYAFTPPEFKLLASTLLAPNEIDGKILSAKFIHGALYVASRGSVQCMFLNNTNAERIFSIDSYVLSSYETPMFPKCTISRADNNYLRSFAPMPLPLSLDQPSVLNVFAGSLLLSTCTGLQAVSLDQPIIRIGILLAANQASRAEPWFGAVNVRHHELLARFLERKGYPLYAIGLAGELHENFRNIYDFFFLVKT